MRLERGEQKLQQLCCKYLCLVTLVSPVLSSLDIKIVPFQSKLWSALSQQFSQSVWEYEDTVDSDYDEVSSALNYISSVQTEQFGSGRNLPVGMCYIVSNITNGVA